MDFGNFATKIFGPFCYQNNLKWLSIKINKLKKNATYTVS